MKPSTKDRTKGEGSAPAYQDPEFMEGNAARPIRILSEFLGPWETFVRNGVRDTIVFFGSARQGAEGPFARQYEDARKLAKIITEWSNSREDLKGRFMICSGGGGGMMQAANQGAEEGGGRSIGLNISLPMEQKPNPYITPELSIGFHYFFMRKLWFAHLAQAMVFFPGGFGSMDEMFEILTLAQTGKLGRRPAIIIYGSKFWKEIVNFDALVRHGMISQKDLDLFKFADEPEEALAILKECVSLEPQPALPLFAESIDSESWKPAGRKDA